MFIERQRDSQRSKVYKSEKVLESFIKERFGDIREIEKYVWKILKTKWSQKRWGVKYRVIVRDGRGRRRAGGRPLSNGVFLTMPVWSRKDWVVLHELAHGLSRKGTVHGWEFCKIYLELVHFRLGKDAAKALKKSFRENGVRFAPKRTRVITEEQRSALRERMEKVRAARLGV